MTRLTQHFDSHEFDCHDGTPVPRWAYDRVEDLCRRYLEPLRARFGEVRVISGYRTRSHNRAVSGARGSFHRYLRWRSGVAADVSCATGTAADWHAALALLDPGGLGKYSGHVHVDTRRGHARW